MKLIEARRLGSLDSLIRSSSPTDHLINEFERLSACYTNIRDNKDKALEEYMNEVGLSFDEITFPIDNNIDTEDLPDEIDEDYLSAIEQAITRIINFYQHERIQSWFVTGHNDELTGQKLNSIEKVAVLMPSKWHFAPITLMMSIIPAIIAGVDELIVNLPPTPGDNQYDPKIYSLIIWLCRRLGITQIFRMPELAAVFAFAAGTETVPKMDKLVGSGSSDIIAASALVSGEVGVKVLPDKNETIFLCDETANEEFVVADLFAAAEDPKLEKVVVITTSTVKATEISAEIETYLNTLDSTSPMRELLNERGSIVLTSTMEEAIDIIEQYPPKYLSLFVQHPMEFLAKIHHAGVLYLGDYSPAGMENYFASSSNLIPTGQCCRYCSPLDVYDFLKKTSIVHYTQRQVEHVSNMINMLAHKDNLPFHRESFEIRLKHLKES